MTQNGHFGANERVWWLRTDRTVLNKGVTSQGTSRSGGPIGAPKGPQKGRGCALTCSTLVPLCSTSLEPLDPLMAEKGRFWLFWTLFGGPLVHPYGPP